MMQIVARLLSKTMRLSLTIDCCQTFVMFLKYDGLLLVGLHVRQPIFELAPL